jgi:hypothetical protein
MGMTNQEIQAKCEEWVDHNRGVQLSNKHMASSLVRFVTRELGVTQEQHVPKPAPRTTAPPSDSVTTRPRMSLEGTRLKWAK